MLDVEAELVTQLHKDKGHHHGEITRPGAVKAYPRSLGFEGFDSDAAAAAIRSDVFEPAIERVGTAGTGATPG